MRFFSILLFLPFFLFAKIDSQDILHQMSLDEKIGQLFMIPACPKRDLSHLNDLKKVIKKFHVGGVIVKQSDPTTQIHFLNHLQFLSHQPLIVSADAEWGLGMRMEKAISFPKNMTLGAIEDNDLLYELGKEIAKELKAVGVHINLAPVIDININPMNPTINIRAFSDDKSKVTQKAYQLMKGMQDENILACLKHFPGYGDVKVDPHLDLPIASHDRKRLEEVELYPYDFLIKNGALAIMSAHIILSKLSDKPATMSKEIIDILITDKNYKNLLITDALNMKALTNNYTIEDIALSSHIAGHDILLYGDHILPNIDDILMHQIPKAFEAIKKAYISNKLPIEKLDAHVLKILKAKEKLNLFENRYTPAYNENIILNPEAYKLKNELFKKSITTIKNETLFPIDLKKIIYLSSKKDITQDLIATKLISKDILVFSVFDDFKIPANKISYLTIYQSDLSEDLFEKIKNLDPNKTAVFFLGSPYLLNDYILKNFKNITLSYEEEREAILATLDFMLGNIKADGQIPIQLKK